MNNTPFDNFNNMDDIFNELMGSMNGINSERRYLINGREVSWQPVPHPLLPQPISAPGF